ncbi:MAG: regulator [Proteobacteria bacterium]|nr:regulator [Pseudomonadota bacterium]
MVDTKPQTEILDHFEVGEDVYVRSLAVEARSQTLWVGTSLGVHEVDLKNRELRNTFTRDHGLANEYVFGIGIDADGYKWFGTNAGGMSRYRDGDWKTFFPMHGLADYWIYAFANDPDGGLWIGTWAGANYLNRKTGEFKTYVKELINEWVYGIAVDSHGAIWFGTEGGVTRFERDSWTSWSHEDGIGGDNPDALPFSRNTGLGTRSRHDLGIMAEGKPTYNPNYVFCILSDQEDTIWAGTWGGGVARFKDGQWTNLMEKDGLAGNIVYSMAQDKSGVYWFGTNKGLSRYDGTRWYNWNIHNGLASNHVYAIAINDNEIWVGTRGAVTRLGIRTAAESREPLS